MVKIRSGSARYLSLRAETDSTVRLYWSPPSHGVPDGYRVMFEPAGDTYSVALETSDTTCVQDPAGMTGQYRVLATYGRAYVEPEETLSTLPVPSITTTVGELSGPDNPGCGWTAPAWRPRAYEMADIIWVDSVEFYVTDFKPGSDGPAYYLASPNLAPADSGGSVPACHWHATSFAALADDESRVPPVGDSAWRTSAVVPSAPRNVACHTQGGYFAVVSVTQMRTQQADVRLQTWFQSVPGLRLLRH